MSILRTRAFTAGPYLRALHFTLENLEASPGIEPGYKDLQSSASPLRHEASLHRPCLVKTEAFQGCCPRNRSQDEGRFRMNIDELQEVLSAAFGFFFSSARPAHRHPSSPPARQRDILRQDEKAQRQHPEAQHREESEHAAENEGQAETDPCAAPMGQANPSVCERDLAICDLKIGHFLFLRPEVLVPDRLSTAWCCPHVHHKSVVFQVFQDFHADFSKNRLANRKSVCITPPTAARR